MPNRFQRLNWLAVIIGVILLGGIVYLGNCY